MSNFKRVVSNRIMKMNRDTTLREYLQEKIRHQIQWDMRVSSSDVHVRVKGDAVELVGVFDKRYRKAAVLEIVNSMPEVRRVVDKTVVQEEYERSDREIAKLIQNEIEELPLLRCEWMDVEVVNGVVTLEGEVLRTRMKAFASGITWAHSGVRDCRNLVRVVDGSGAVAIALGLEAMDSRSIVNERAAKGEISCKIPE